MLAPDSGAPFRLQDLRDRCNLATCRLRDQHGVILAQNGIAGNTVLWNLSLKDNTLKDEVRAGNSAGLFEMCLDHS